MFKCINLIIGKMLLHILKNKIYINKIKKLSSFKSNENIHKREDGSYYVVSANKASSVTL